MNMKTIQLHIEAVLELMTLSWLKYRENEVSAKHIILVALLVVFPLLMMPIAPYGWVILTAVICLGILTSLFMGVIIMEFQVRKMLSDADDAKQQIQDDIDNAGSC